MSSEASPGARLLVHGSRSQPPERELATGDWWILEMDRRLPRDRAPEGARWCVIEDFLSEDDLEAVDEQTAEFARSWFRVDGRDVSEVGGFSVGEGLALHVFLNFNQAFKNLQLAERVLGAHRFEKVFIGSGTAVVEWAWAHAAEAHGVAVETLMAGGDSVRGSSASEWVYSFSRQGLEQMLRGTFRQLLGWAWGWAVRSDRPVMALREGRATTAAWFDQIKDCDEWRHVSLWKGPTLPSVIAGLLKWRPRLERRWRDHHAQIGRQAAFTFKDRSLWPHLEAAMRGLFVDRGAQMVAQGRVFEAYFERMRVSAAVLSWHQVDVITAIAAKRLGIPWIVLQDCWLPGKDHPAGFRRFVPSDHLLAWGEISAGWCRQMPGTQVHVAGDPGIEAFRVRAPEKTESDGAGRSLRALLTHQCWGPWSAFHSPLDTNDTITVFAEAARRLPRVRAAIKVHPLVEDPRHEGRGRFAAMQEDVAALGHADVGFLPLDSSMPEALADCDVVVTYYSLTAVEALCVGKRVIVLNVSGKRDLFPELVDAEVAPRTEEVDGLVGLIEALQHAGTPPPSNEDQEKLREFLEDVFGPPRPIAELVRSLLPAPTARIG